MILDLLTAVLVMTQLFVVMAAALVLRIALSVSQTAEPVPNTLLGSRPGVGAWELNTMWATSFNL